MILPIYADYYALIALFCMSIFFIGMAYKYKNIFVHIIICVSFLMIPHMFDRHHLFRIPDVVNSVNDRVSVILYSLMLGIFYLNHYVLIPKLYLNKKYSTYFGAILLILVLLLIFYFIFDRPPDGMPPPHHNFEKHYHDIFHRGPPPMHRNQLIFLYTIGILISLFARINQNLKRIEFEKNKTALAYLKSQINPHFLFNTFNSIYGLAVKEKADNTAGGMLKLSNILRYVLTETQSDFVSLQKEIAYLNNYVELQKLRIEKNTNLRYKTFGDMENKLIAPMLMIPFIENAFKYGINPGVESDISISISVHENLLNMEVKNKKIADRRSSEKTGIGIENSKKRLALLYPSRHILDISESETEYLVILKINL